MTKQQYLFHTSQNSGRTNKRREEHIKEEILAENTMINYLRYTIRVADITGPSPTARIIAVQYEGLLEITDLLEFDKEGINNLLRKP